MRIIECDRCHKRFNKDAKKTGYVNLDLRDIGSGELEGNHEFDDWDVCDDCMREIRNFILKIQPKEEKTKATIKKMPVQGKTITKPDWIRRLASEGKTIKEICELTGCSEPTARKYKAEVTPNEETEPVTESVSED